MSFTAPHVIIHALTGQPYFYRAKSHEDVTPTILEHSQSMSVSRRLFEE